MTNLHTTAVIGLGLMGGSLARDLAERGGRVFAYDSRPEVVEQAIEAGIVADRLDDSLAGVANADLVVIATPVDAALETLARLAPYLSTETVVTDVGSVKRTIGDRAIELSIGARFVGSHPLAGDHRSGWSAARPGLYSRATVFLCPTAVTEPAAMAAVGKFWTGVGAVAVEMDAAEHDRRMAWISHLPQVVASSVAATLRQEGCAAVDLGPGGRDVTRLAASSPDIWSAICLANADYLAESVAHFQRRLDSFQSALRDSDIRALHLFFEDAQGWVSTAEQPGEK